ncbi:MAG: response regulator [Methylococcales bacterium]|nr:response regulator [Methylococcales bacterium]
MLSNLSLKNRLLVWFLPIALLPVLVGGMVIYHSSVEKIHSDVNHKLQVLVDKKTNEINLFFQDYKNNVIAIAEMPQLIQIINQYNHDLKPVNINLNQSGFFQYLQKYIQRFDIDNIIVADIYGDILLTVTSELGNNVNTITEPYRIRESPLASAFNSAIVTQQVTLSNIGFLKPVQDLAMFVAAPVMHKGKVLGVVLIQFNAESINSLLADYSDLSKTGDIGIASPLLGEAVQITSLRHLPDAAFQLRSNFTDDDLLVQSVKQNIGSGIFQDHRGIKVFAAWKKLSQINWGLRVTIDVEEAMQPITEITMWFFSIGLVSVLTMTIIIIIISRKLTQPISELIVVTKRLAGGDLDIQAKVHDQSELAELGLSFNYMTRQLRHSRDQLQKSHHQLEQRVEDRTRDLKIAKNSAERLQRIAELANGAKSHFLASMSHELRTPLTSIIGLVELMDQHPKLNKIENRYIATINESSNQLLTLINNILDVAKIEAEQATLESNEINLNNFLQSIISMFVIRAKKKGLIIHQSFSKALPQSIHVDKLKLRQVLVNLLDNAIKYSEKGKIILNLNFEIMSENSGELYFEIIDQGIGIADEEMELLFMPFSQTQSGRQTNLGTGLGLSISQHFVKLMGGEIRVKSQENSGSIFSFFIPTTYSEISEIKVVKQQIVGIKLNQGQPPPRILIVEDKEAIRMMLTAHLERVGFNVQIACNGQEGIEQFESTCPDLIIMDYLMPVMEGTIATKKIRLMPKGESVKIIMLTASISEESQIEHKFYNYDAIIHKPLKIKSLLKIIGKILDIQFIYQEIKYRTT